MLVIQFMQRVGILNQCIKVAHQIQHALMELVAEQMPVEALIVVPFALLSELVAHEQELLSRMAVHEAVIGPEIGKSLPAIAGHAAEDRALAMHDLVKAQRQDEILRESVEQAEG